MKSRTNQMLLIAAITVSGLVITPDAMASHHDASLDSPIKLSLGQTTVLKSAEISITLADLSDSRCPKNVTCIWEGEVTVTLNVTKGLETVSILEIKTSQDSSVEIEEYSITLTKVEPYPEEGMDINKEQYVVTLLIDEFTKAPLDQFEAGVSINDVQCKSSLVLLQKYDGTPACVSKEPAPRLVERGWTIVESAIDSFEECVTAGNPVMESFPRQCRTTDGQTFVEEIPRMASPEFRCNEFGGNWLEEFKECEYISSEQCSEFNGEYLECESACRHDPDAEVCTLQCVPVCLIP